MQITFQTQPEGSDFAFHVVIPYEENTQAEAFLMQLPFLCQNRRLIGQLMEEKGKAMLILQEQTWMSLSLLKLKKEGSFVRALEETFAGFGKEMAQDSMLWLDALPQDTMEEERLVETIVRAVTKGAYRFKKEALTEVDTGHLYQGREQLTEEKDDLRLLLVKQTGREAEIQNGIHRGQVYGHCINLARTISNLPNNYLHVAQFAAYARELAKAQGLTYHIFGRRELEEMHAGGILSVNAGSPQEAALISLEYAGNPDEEKTAVIGKGVMFDAGGYHLKSFSGMEGMKFDMCGAASVLAVIEIEALLHSDSCMMAVIPAVENVIGPDATKMGDVITTMSGKTVEVDNTDAEGRLILCDALTYAQRRGAKKLIDLATLTYSCQAALGDEISGIFSNSDTYYGAFMKSAAEMGDRLWRLPLDDAYRKLLKRSAVADLNNYAAGKNAGASVAACFLEEFIDRETEWLHLDVVGSAVCREETPSRSVGASGILIQTIAAFVEEGSRKGRQ